MGAASKRIPVSEKTLERVKKLGHKGQTYDELLQEMAEAYERQQFLEELEKRREEGEFVDLDEALG